MSVKIMGAIWDCELPPVEKLVLLAFADHADHEGRNVYPSNRLIAYKTGFSVRQIEKIRARFVSRGVLVCEGRSPFRTKSYRIDLDVLPEREPFEGQNRRGRPEINTEQCSVFMPKIPSSEAINTVHDSVIMPKIPNSDAINTVHGSVKPSINHHTDEPSIKPSDSISQPLDGAHYTPAQAWIMALDQLHAEMPKAAFDTWVKDLRLIDFYGNRAVIAAGNQYAADWLTSRLTSTVARLLTGILNRSVSVEFQLAF